MMTSKEIDTLIKKIHIRNIRQPIIEHTLRMCERKIEIIEESNGNVQYAWEERPITKDDILIENK